MLGACMMVSGLLAHVAAGQDRQRVEIGGLPPLDLPTSLLDPQLEDVLSAVDAALRDTAPAGGDREALRTWQERRAAALESIGPAARAIPAGDSRRLGLLAMGFVTEDTVARSPDANARHEGVVQTMMAVCSSLTEPDLQPWVARCRALNDYWTAIRRWRAGPVWPSECTASPARSTAVVPAGSATLAVLLSSSGTSLRPERETRALRASVLEAARRWLPEVHVLGIDELEAAERAHVAERRLDGSACLSGDLVRTLEHTHARLWVAHVSATCPAHGHTGSCRLSVSFTSSTADGELPRDRAVDLGVGTASIDDFVGATARLTEVPPSPIPRTGHFGVRMWRPPMSRLSGFSSAMDAIEIVGVLTPTRGALQSCRDLDASPAGEIDAALELAADGHVIGVTLTPETRGAQRRACVERVFGALRFRASPETSRTVVVSGELGLAAESQVALRISEPSLRLGARASEALIACHPAGDVAVATLDVERAADGSLTATAAAPATPLAECAARALGFAVSQCDAPSRSRVTICIGAPSVPSRPTRP